MKPAVTLMWFRRDLRLEDNAALFHALQSGFPVLPVFIFDRNILDQLDDKADLRVAFIHKSLLDMQQQLLLQGSTLDVRYGYPENVFASLLEKYDLKKVFANHDYEPYARDRETKLEKWMGNRGIDFHTYKDQVIFEKEEVIKDDGKPYTVFTPYSRKWKARLAIDGLRFFPSVKHLDKLYKQPALPLPALESMGFRSVDWLFPSVQLPDAVISHYTEKRNFPSLSNGTSRLGVHLRFGTISIRSLADRASKLNETYLNELIWRDFYHMILWHFPRVGKGKSFKPDYEMIEWRNNEAEFARWCEGNTGYPIVDAGMRELNQTGFMHNRVRMIVASFLTKHLLIDWRWGEAYFAQKLLDFDLAANNGGWQWASGSGCDAAPYFRVFNPYLQTDKFDKDRKYIRQWVPEYQEFSYPQPIVVHEVARKRVLETYAKALKK